VTTIAAYVSTLRGAQEQVAAQMGSQLRGQMRDRRTEQVSMLGLLAVVCKTLVDKGLIADADLQATFTAAIGQIWPPEPDVTPGT
jgi:hypothetical protein